jgi:hypothetical protein
LAKIAGGDFHGSDALSQSMRPAKSVVFAGVLGLRAALARGRTMRLLGASLQIAQHA